MPSPPAGKARLEARMGGGCNGGFATMAPIAMAGRGSVARPDLPISRRQLQIRSGHKRAQSSNVRLTMEIYRSSNDPLLQEIASLEIAITHDTADIAELEGLLAKKNQNIQMLLIEIRALKKAASLRPTTTAKVESPAPEPASAPGPKLGGLRGVVGPLRGSESRFVPFGGDNTISMRPKPTDPSPL